MTWEMKAGLMGKPEREASAHLLSFFPQISLSIDDYITQRNILQDQHWPHVQLLPGVERLVAHLHAHGIPTAIATGSRRRNLELKTAHLQHLFGLFGARVVCGDDPWISERGGRGKPFPDVFLVAAREALGRDVGGKGEVGEVEGEVVPLEQREERARGLVFEDAIPGVQAGKRAGMNVVWVPDPNLLGMEANSVHGADQVLKSLEEFVPEEWGLPPYNSTTN
ncbi:HAD-like protein [Dentipellis sp. KUC8613]|nr:HAD-like protein [Dentipellis sp. KUC8613]